MATTIKEFDIKQSATLPVISTQLVGPDGNPLNLTGTTITFRMKLHNSNATLISGLASIVTGNANLPPGSTLPNAYYQWVAGNTATVGLYDVEWQVDYGGGLLMILPGKGYNAVRVSAKLS